jgi:5-methylcytosine-specific restriction protein A
MVTSKRGPRHRKRKTSDKLGWEWGRIRKAKIAQNQRDNAGQCERGDYGCLGDATEVHHTIARIDTGGHNDGTLEALCSACHQRATTELVQRLATERRAIAKEKRQRNHPGRKDRYDG